MRLIIGWETPVNRAVYLCFGGSSWAVHRLIFLMTSGERTDEALRFVVVLSQLLWQFSEPDGQFFHKQ